MITPISILDDESLQPLFVGSHPMRVAVTDEKRLSRWAVETGDERSDHVIDNAIEINIDLVLVGDDDVTQYSALRDAYRDLRLVAVQTRMRTYPSMLIEAIPHDEDARVGAMVAVRLSEWREVTPEQGEVYQPATSEYAGTTSRGRVQGSDPEPEAQRKGSILSRLGLP